MEGVFIGNTEGSIILQASAYFSGQAVMQSTRQLMPQVSKDSSIVNHGFVLYRLSNLNNN